MWICIYTFVFLTVFSASAIFKLTHKPEWAKDYSVDWNQSIGTSYIDIPYGEDGINKFDLYLPADSTKENYGLVVYLHAGGFTSGDKSDDTSLLQYFCSKGYVTAGINYTLRTDENPDSSVYTQSMNIKESIPYVVASAEKLGYKIDEMIISGGSAGGCLALLYAYRDAKTSPIPVKAVISAVGPSSFYPQDWSNYGFDKDTNEAKEAAAGLFSVMAGKEIKPEWFNTEIYDQEIKDISALLWVDENTVPTLLASGVHDTIQPHRAAIRLDEMLTKYKIPHDFIVFHHSGHGLQNDDKDALIYNKKIDEYLNRYMPIR